MTEREKKERGRRGGVIMMMMMMRVMMRGHEPKQRQNDTHTHAHTHERALTHTHTKVRINLCLPPHFLPPFSPSVKLTSIIHPFTPSLSPSQLVSPPFLVYRSPVICIQRHRDCFLMKLFSHFRMCGLSQKERQGTYGTYTRRHSGELCKVLPGTPVLLK